MDDVIFRVRMSFRSKADRQADQLEAHFSFEFEVPEDRSPLQRSMKANSISSQMGLDTALSKLFEEVLDAEDLTDLEAEMVLVARRRLE